MKNVLLKAAGVALAVMLSPAANATVFPVGSPNFFLTSGTPFSDSITANFYHFIDTAGNFDDSFTFTLPQDGTGSGSLSTSFSSEKNHLFIDDVIINGTSFASQLDADGGLSVNGIPIFEGVLNTIQVLGHTTAVDVFTGGLYSGTATFSAAPIPEPATWLMMLGGFGLVGIAARRRQKTALSLS